MAETTPPVIATASINAAGTTLTVTFTEAGSPPVLPASGATGFTLTASGGAVTVVAPAISTLTLTASLSRGVNTGETVTLDYTPGNVTDSAVAPNAMLAASAVSVTNNSARTALAASVATFGHATSDDIRLAWTAATAGSSPYTYDVHRSPTRGFTPITGTRIAQGISPLYYDDPHAVADQFNYYKIVANDATSEQITSNEVTARLRSRGITVRRSRQVR